ncbi:unnamed protein product, partial [Effrenium voratum]
DTAEANAESEADANDNSNCVSEAPVAGAPTLKHTAFDKFLTKTQQFEDFMDWRQRIQTYMDYLAGALVLLNSVFMMLELELQGYANGSLFGHDGGPDAKSVEEWFETLDSIFVFLFLAEWIARVGIEQWRFVKDFANWFDSFLVFVGVTDFLMRVLAQDGGGASRSIVVLRLMRALKSLRAIRMVRSLRFFQGLRVLVRACQCFLPSLCWAMVLLGIFMAMGALLMGNMLLDFVKDTSQELTDREWIWWRYGTAFRAMYTLFEITFAGNWPTNARPVLEK